MNEAELAADHLSKIMQQCKPHLSKIHKIFSGAAEITVIVRVHDIPGALLLSAAGKEITPQALIQSLQELVDQKAGAEISAYGGKI